MGNIRISEFRRDDGVTMILHSEDRWLIRKIFGPAWFWRDGIGWQICTRMSKEEVAACALPFARAIELLDVVEISPKRVPCTYCNGTGSDVGRFPIEGCRRCDGDGSVVGFR